MAQSSPIENYVDDLIREKKFPALDPEVMAKIRQDLFIRVDDFLLKRAIDELSDQDVKTFEKLMQDGGGEAEIQQFLMTHVPNLDDMLTKSLIDFRSIYLGHTTPSSSPTSTVHLKPAAPPPRPNTSPIPAATQPSQPAATQQDRISLGIAVTEHQRGGLSGILVGRVRAGSVGERIGLQEGDLILILCGWNTSSMLQLEKALEWHVKATDTITATIYRGGAYLELPRVK
jgi:hypothetical protein